MFGCQPTIQYQCGEEAPPGNDNNDNNVDSAAAIATECVPCRLQIFV